MEQLPILPSDRILILAPHPDDESIACGGVLLKYPSQCDVLVLTDGRHGGREGQSFDEVIAMRQLELKKAMLCAGIKNVISLGIEDGTLQKNFMWFSPVELDEYDIVFCPSPEDNHIDHSCVYDFLLKNKILAKVYAYELWSALSQPTHYIDISDLVERKKHLINYYVSQVAQVKYDDRIIGLNHYRGMLVYPAILFAEAYEEMEV